MDYWLPLVDTFCSYSKFQNCDCGFVFLFFLFISSSLVFLSCDGQINFVPFLCISFFIYKMTGLGLVLKTFIYFGCTGRCCCAQAFFGRSEWRLLQFWCVGFSLLWLLLLQSVDSRVHRLQQLAHGLRWHTDSVAPQRVASSQCVCVCAQLCPTLCSPMDCSMPGFSVHWISLKNTRVGCHFLLQGMFLIQGLNPHLLHWQADSLSTVPPGKAIFPDQGSNWCSLHCKADS